MTTEQWPFQRTPCSSPPFRATDTHKLVLPQWPVHPSLSFRGDPHTPACPSAATRTHQLVIPRRPVHTSLSFRSGPYTPACPSAVARTPQLVIPRRPAHTSLSFRSGPYTPACHSGATRTHQLVIPQWPVHSSLSFRSGPYTPACHSGATRRVEPGIGHPPHQRSSLADLRPQIVPIGIRICDQPDFPGTPPLFQLLFPLNRFDHRTELFKVH